MSKAKKWSDFDKTDEAARGYDHCMEGMILIGTAIVNNHQLTEDEVVWLNKLYRYNIRFLSDWYKKMTIESLERMLSATQKNLKPETMHRQTRKLNWRLRRCIAFLAASRYWHVARYGNDGAEDWSDLVGSSLDELVALVDRLQSLGNSPELPSFLVIQEPPPAKTKNPRPKSLASRSAA